MKIKYPIRGCFSKSKNAVVKRSRLNWDLEISVRLFYSIIFDGKRKRKNWKKTHVYLRKSKVFSIFI